MKAIYIESEMFLRRMLEEIFGREGHEITTLESSEDTLHFVKDLQPDVVILDVGTLGEKWDEYRDALDKVSQIPVVALTYEEKGIHLSQEQKERPQTFIIDKPFRVDQVFEKIYQSVRVENPYDREA